MLCAASLLLSISCSAEDLGPPPGTVDPVTGEVATLTPLQEERVQQWIAYFGDRAVDVIIQRANEQHAAAILDDSVMIFGAYAEQIGGPMIELNKSMQQTDERLASRVVALQDVQSRLNTQTIYTRNLANQSKSVLDQASVVADQIIQILDATTVSEDEHCAWLTQELYEAIPVAGNFIGPTTAQRVYGAICGGPFEPVLTEQPGDTQDENGP